MPTTLPVCRQETMYSTRSASGSSGFTCRISADKIAPKVGDWNQEAAIYRGPQRQWQRRPRQGGKIAPMLMASNRSPLRIVQSRQNSRVKELRAGFARGTRSENGRISIEGAHLLEEAVRSKLRVAAVFVRTGSAALFEGLLAALPLSSNVELLELLPDIFASAVATDSPQGIAALVEVPAFSLENVFPANL